MYPLVKGVAMAGKRELAEIRDLMEELTDRLADLSDEAQATLLEESGQLIESVRDRAGVMMDRVREKTHEVATRAREAGKRADEYAHEEPWKVAAGAAVLGALIGYILASRKQ